MSFEEQIGGAIAMALVIGFFVGAAFTAVVIMCVVFLWGGA